MRRNVDGLSCPFHGRLEAAIRLVRSGQVPCRASRYSLHASPLGGLPPCEGHTLRQVEAIEELSPIWRQRPLPIMTLDRGLELQCVAPEALGSDADFVSPSVEHHSRSDHAADRTNGLVRRPSCVLLIVLWPEQGEKSAPRVPSTRLRKYQPGAEPNA